MKQTRFRGFTLIELLVVIAIIGILSAVVLASLNTARSKGNDAKIQTQMQSIQTAAEVYYSSNANYGAAINCATAGMGLDTNSGLAALMTAINWPNAVAPVCTTDSASAATKYAAFHALSSNTAAYWCVDSTGKSENSGTTASGTGCP